MHESNKPSVIVVNKWDKIEKDTFTQEGYKATLNEELKFMSYYKTAFISALTGKRVPQLISMLENVYENASRQVPTGILNDVMQDAMSVNEPPNYNGKKLRVYYTTQTMTNPPTFTLFVNDERIMHFSYKRYLFRSCPTY